VQIFLLSLGEEEAVSAVRQFCDLLSQKKQKQDRDLSFCDLLLLTVFAYSLAEGGQWKDVDDQQLRELLTEAANAQPEEALQEFSE
jgi:hypothetical protein